METEILIQKYVCCACYQRLSYFIFIHSFSCFAVLNCDGIMRLKKILLAAQGGRTLKEFLQVRLQHCQHNNWLKIIGKDNLWLGNVYVFSRWCLRQKEAEELTLSRQNVYQQVHWKEMTFFRTATQRTNGVRCFGSNIRQSTWQHCSKWRVRKSVD